MPKHVPVNSHGLKIVAAILADIFDLPAEAEAHIVAALSAEPHAARTPVHFTDAAGKTYGQAGVEVYVDLLAVARENDDVAHLLSYDEEDAQLRVEVDPERAYNAQTALAAYVSASDWFVDGDPIESPAEPEGADESEAALEVGWVPGTAAQDRDDDEYEDEDSDDPEE